MVSGIVKSNAIFFDFYFSQLGNIQKDCTCYQKDI